MEFDVKEFAKTHSVPFYLFDEKLFLDNMNRLTSTFQSVYSNYRVAYSFKTNYTPYICKLVKENGGYAEVVSDMEYSLAKNLGYENRKIIYNGPFKGALLEDHLLAGGIANADNYNECERICRLAESHPEKVFKIGLRLNLDLGAGFISRFGMVEDSKDMLRSVELINRLDNLHVVGMHCHIKAPRNPEAWKRRSEIMIAAADKYVEGIPEYISLGSGMVPGEYSQYADDFENFKPTYQEFAEALFAPFINHYPERQRPIVFTEPGRALITRYIRFFAIVDNFKEVRERKLATTNGSFHNIGEIYSQARIPVIVHHNSEGKYYDKIDIMGYTCLEQDVMFPSYEGNLSVGDIIEFRNVGGYSIVYKPQFIYPQCAMYALHHDGTTEMIMRKETFDDVFSKFL
jgi:diaminopimelate decarboxylase